MMVQRLVSRLFVAALAALAPAVSGAADAWPTRPVKIIVPFNAGGATDVVARLLAQKLSEAWGQGVVVENRAGAGGNIGADVVAKSPPDGYTLLVGYTSSVMIAPVLLSGAGLNPVTDLAPIARFALVPYICVAHPSLPATNLKALVALAKARPGQINFASAGTGGLPHLSGELFKLITHVDIVHVPYRGAASAHTDLVGGHVQMQFTGISGVAPSVKAGKLRALAVTTAHRSPLLPDVATAAESGFPALDVSSSLGILAPANTPAPVVRRLHEEIAKIVGGADMTGFIVKQGAEPAMMDPAEWGAHIKAEMAKWARVIKAAGLKPE